MKWASLSILMVPGLLLAEPAIHRPTAIAFPDDIAGFARGRETDFEPQSPGAGVAYPYTLRRGVEATVYVYSANQCPVPSGISDASATLMREETIRGIHQVAARDNETVVPLARQTVELPGERGAVPVFEDVFRVDGRGASRITMAWHWAARGHFLKIRVTNHAPQVADDGLMRAFAAGVVRLAPPDESAETLKANRKVPPNVSVALQGERSRNLDAEQEAWLLYGLSALVWATQCVDLERLPSGLLALPFRGEHEARRNQLRIWRDKGRQRHPGLPFMEEMLQVDEAGFLREYIWRHHHRPEWGSSLPGLRLEEYSAWQSRHIPDHRPQTPRAAVLIR